MTVRVLGLSGSLRRESLNEKLLGAAAELLPPGVRLEPWDGLKAIPPFDEDDEARPAFVVDQLRASVRRAQCVLIATPEYNGSVPGQLKNALDWLSRPTATSALRGKPVAVIGASTGMFGAVWAQAELRRVLGLIGARVIDAELPVATASEAFDAAGALRDGELASRLEEICAVLVAEAGRSERAA